MNYTIHVPEATDFDLLGSDRDQASCCQDKACLKCLKTLDT